MQIIINATMSEIEAAPSKNSRFVNASLQRMVDWKVFELSALLIDKDITKELYQEGQLWLQPRHLDEIIEERVNNSLCGHLLCNNSLTSSNRPSSGTRYRLEYNNKRVFEVNEDALKYCCLECYERSEIYRRNLDTSAPYSRPVAKELIKEHAKHQNPQATAAGMTVGDSYATKGIDDIISLLSRGEEAVNIVSEVSSPNIKNNIRGECANSSDEDEHTKDLARKDKEQQQMLSPPPIYSSQSLSEYGEVNRVEFAAGQPVVRSVKHPIEDVSIPQQTKIKQESSLRVRFEIDNNFNTQTSETPDAVYMPDNLFSKSNSKVDQTNPQPKSGTNSPSLSPSKKNGQSIGSTPTKEIIVSKPAQNPNVLELLKGMETLQMKYDLPRGTNTSAPLFAPRRSAASNFSGSSTTITTKVVKEEQSPGMTRDKSTHSSEASPDRTSSAYQPFDDKPEMEIPVDEDGQLMDTMTNSQKASENKVNSRRVRRVIEWRQPSPKPRSSNSEPVMESSDERVIDSTSTELPSYETSYVDNGQVLSKAVGLDLSGVNSTDEQSSTSSIPPAASVGNINSQSGLHLKGILKNEAPKKSNYKPIPKIKTPIVAISVNEKPNAVPLSAAALLSKREPSAIEGYVPNGIEYNR